MSERNRRIIIGVIGLGSAAMWFTDHAHHHATTANLISAVCFLLCAVMPWSWHSWHEQPPADRQG